MILDGYGIAEDPSVSAIDAANKPFLDKLFAQYPHSTLEASSRAVGLPEGQMGNSEVGHMNLGAGRVLYQDITKIDLAIESGEFFENAALKQAFERAKVNDKKVHLMGLVSDGGVHSSIEHILALIEMAAKEELGEDKLCIHAFTDGRDTAPNGGADYVRRLQNHCLEYGIGDVVSVIGRYYAMDRDKRWERIELAYDLLVKGEGQIFDDVVDGIEASYRSEITDEFIRPIVQADTVDSGRIEDGDEIIFFNFRADRGRQLTTTLTDEDFGGFVCKDIELGYTTFTIYDSAFKVDVAFPKDDVKMTLGEVLEKAGKTQLRAAETEKYPHVTFFFSGGRELPFEGEDRVLAQSPKVATYDLQPEMSAQELAEAVVAKINSDQPDFIVLNFANPDMVGHTGVFEAAVIAVETVDACAELVFNAARKHNYSVEIIADHGNADKMINPDGSVHTAHTTALVPHIIVKEGFDGPLKPGKLGDIAPTCLALMGLDIPEEMTGEVLLETKN